MKRKYLVVFYRMSDNFAGHAPDVPGCFSVGNTLEEMSANMTEALEFHLEGLAEEGLTIPEARTTALDFSPEGENYDPSVLYTVVEWLEVGVPAGKTSHSFAAAD